MTREASNGYRWPVALIAALALLLPSLVILAVSRVRDSALIEALSADLRVAALFAALVVVYAVPVGVAALWARLDGTSPAHAFGLRAFDVALGLGGAVVLSFGARILGVVYAFAAAAAGIEPGEVPDVTSIFPEGASGMFALVALAVVLAPLAEELLFRGVIYPGLRAAWGRTAGLVASSALFALFHVSLFFAPVYFGLGFALALLRDRTGSVWPPIIAHALFNAQAIALLYLLPDLARSVS